jgi:hypothetical protein
MKDCVVLGGREFNSAKKVEQDLGIGHKTRKKWIESGSFRNQCGSETACILIGRHSKIKYWRLVKSSLENKPRAGEARGNQIQYNQNH